MAMALTEGAPVPPQIYITPKQLRVVITANNKHQIVMASIAEVLGLTEDWSDLQEVKVQKALSKEDGFAEAMVSTIKQIQEKDFGNTTEVSDYERKVIYSGWLMGVEIAQERAKMQMIQLLMKAGLDPSVMFNSDDDDE